MILRILRGRATSADIERLLDAVRFDIEDWRADGSLVACQPAYREVDGDIEFLLVSTWATAESVLARGGEVSLPRGRLGAATLLRQPHAAHYELMLDKVASAPRRRAVVRLSTVALAPGLAAAFYERVRRLWDALVIDAGLEATTVGRRIGPDTEQAVVVTVWDSESAVASATSGGFVGGDEMAMYYATEPVIEHFTALDIDG